MKNVYQNVIIFLQEYTFEYGVCQVAAMLSQAHFPNNFSIIIQIQWIIRFSGTPL